MRALFWLLVVFAAAVALVILGRAGASYVMFVYPPYRVELSLLFFVAASLAGFLLLCAGFVAFLGFGIAGGARHAFAGDVRIGLVFWLMALGMTIIAIVLFRRSSRRVRSLRELRLHESKLRSEMGTR